NLAAAMLTVLRLPPEDVKHAFSNPPPAKDEFYGNTVVPLLELIQSDKNLAAIAGSEVAAIMCDFKDSKDHPYVQYWKLWKRVEQSTVKNEKPYSTMINHGEPQRTVPRYLTLWVEGNFGHTLDVAGSTAPSDRREIALRRLARFAPGQQPPGNSSIAEGAGTT